MKRVFFIPFLFLSLFSFSQTMPVKQVIGASITKSTIQSVVQGATRNDGSSIVKLNNGNLLMVYQNYYGATTNDADSARIMQRTSTDGGFSWSASSVLKDTINGHFIYTPSLCKKSNGNVILFFLEKVSNSATAFWQMESTDTTATSWNAPVKIYDSPSAYSITFADRLFKSKSGRWFFPIEINYGGAGITSEAGNYHQRFLYSDNEGSTWTLSSVTLDCPDGLAVEGGFYSATSDFDNSNSTIAERIVCYFRTRSDDVYAAYSDNNGGSFSSVYNLGIAAPNSTSTIKNINGVLVAVHNRLFTTGSYPRAIMDLSISRDNGLSWNRAITIAEKDSGWYFFEPNIYIDSSYFIVNYSRMDNAGVHASLQQKIIPIGFINLVSSNYKTALAIPKGTTAQRPGTGVTGVRYNSTLSVYEIWNPATSHWDQLKTEPTLVSETPQTLTDGAVITLNPYNGKNAQVTLGGVNRVLSITPLPPAGTYGELIVKQDATGGRTMNLPTGSLVPGNWQNGLQLTGTANSIDKLRWYYDGSNFYFSPELNFVTTNTSGLEPEAQAFLTAANISDNTLRTALNNYVIGLKSDGIWNDVINGALWPMLSDGVNDTRANQCKYNLANPSTFTLGFPAGWTYNANGAKPDGVTAATTGLFPATVSPDNNYIFFYMSTDDIRSSAYEEMGTYQTSLRRVSLWLARSGFEGGVCTSRQVGQNYAGTTAVFGMGVSTPSSAAYYQNNVLQLGSSSTTETSTPPALELFLGGRNNQNGSTADATTRRCAIAGYIPAAWTTTQITAFYNRTKTFLSAAKGISLP